MRNALNLLVKSSYLPVLALLAFSHPAYASGSAMTDVICVIVNWFQGNLGTGLATIGVSAVAVGAILGKVSWGLALTVAVGISMMFGATDVLISIGIIDAGVC